MKYYILNEDYNNCKNCFLENRNSLDFMMEYYEGKLFESTEVIEISFNKDVKNKYLPLKNVLALWGLRDSCVVDKTTMEKLKKEYDALLDFIPVELIDENQAENTDFYIIYYRELVSGLDKDRSRIKFLPDDTYVVDENASLSEIFKFKNLTTRTFADETFKKFVEDNHIEGWTFREAFEI